MEKIIKINTEKKFRKAKKMLEINDIDMKEQLVNYKLPKQEKIYIMIEKKEIIGYVIIANIKKLDKKIFKNYDKRKCYNYMYKVKTENEKFVIQDIYISNKIRNKGYGKKLVNYIIKKYKNKKIALHPVDNGIYFWQKFNIEKKKENDEFRTWILNTQ